MMKKRLFGITLKVDFQPIWQLATIGNKIHPMTIPNAAMFCPKSKDAGIRAIQ